MSVLLDFAALCNQAADALSDQISDLGPKPNDPVAAAAWSMKLQRLNGQINSLTRIAIQDSAQAVLDALDVEQPCLDDLAKVTAGAEQRVKQIEHVAALLTTVSRILDVGLAILSTAQDPANLPSLITAVSALGKDAGVDLV